MITAAAVARGTSLSNLPGHLLIGVSYMTLQLDTGAFACTGHCWSHSLVKGTAGRTPSSHLGRSFLRCSSISPQTTCMAARRGHLRSHPCPMFWPGPIQPCSEESHMPHQWPLNNAKLTRFNPPSAQWPHRKCCIWESIRCFLAVTA